MKSQRPPGPYDWLSIQAHVPASPDSSYVFVCLCGWVRPYRFNPKLSFSQNFQPIQRSQEAHKGRCVVHRGRNRSMSQALAALAKAAKARSARAAVETGK